MERPKLNFHEKQEPVWIVQQNQDGQSAHNFIGVAVSDVAATQLPGLDHSKSFISTRVMLYRPSLAPIYGGPTLTEALWNEMDRLMENLMTGQEADDVCGRKGEHGAPERTYEGSGLGFNEPCEHQDNGDKYRAQELAWVLAIVANPYEPNVDAIRAEAMRRWNSQQEES